MKKFLKNANLLIITILILIIGTNNVKAVSCSDSNGDSCRSTEYGDWVSTETYKDGTSTIMNKTYSSKTLKYYNLSLYNGNKSSDSKYYYTHQDVDHGKTIYCLDADKAATKKVYLQRFLLKNDSTKNVYLHDLAIMSILVNSQNSSSEDVSVSIAIRTINTLFGLDQTGTATEGDFTRAYKGLAYKWAIGDEHYAEVKEAYDKLAAELVGKSHFASSSELSNYSSWRFGDNGGTTLQKARELFNEALIESASALYIDDKAYVDEPKSEILNDGVKTEKDSIGEKAYLDIKYTFNLKNFTSDGKASFKIDSLAYAKGYQAVGAISEPKIIRVDSVGTPICEGDSCNIIGKNLLEGMSLPTTSEITVTIRFEGYKSRNDGSKNILTCGGQPMEYNLKYSYNDTNLVTRFPEYVGAVWYGIGDNNEHVTEKQRYISIVKSGAKQVDKSENAKGEVTLITECNCSSLLEACEATKDIASKACKELEEAGCPCEFIKAQCDFGDSNACKEYEESCEVKCDTYVEQFKCCDANDKLIVEGEQHSVNIYGPGSNNPDADNVKACFVTQVNMQKPNEDKGYTNVAGIKDQKGNSYTLNEVANNKYCSVSCKEDYESKMPTGKIVNAGRYFTFKANVRGIKTCYTNTIDREQFNKDMVAVQEELVEAYSRFAYWKSLKGLEPEPEDHADSNSCCVDWDCCPTDEGCEKCCVDWCDKHTEWTTYSVSNTYNYHHVTSKNINTGRITIESIPLIAVDAQDGHTDGSCDCCYCIAGVSGTAENVKTDVNAYYEETLKELQAVQEKFEQIIKDYNACSGWNSEINYDAKLTYDYDEDYLDKFSLIGEMEDTPVSSSSNAWYCNSTFTSDGSETKLAEITDKDYTRCSGSTSSSTTMTKINYIYCDEDTPCTYETREVSNARYKKTESFVETSYRPKTLFYNTYPAGIITDSEEDNTVAIENGLPVNLSTEKGIYPYSITIDNLGEFYNNPTHDLGRYSGAPTSVAVDYPKRIEYACSYLVNINSTDWVCDANCTGDDCITKCVGPYCEEEFCDGEDCITKCIGIGCMYDTELGTSFNQKEISLSNIFTNGTNSYNWNCEAPNDKACATIDEIEGANDTIFDEDPILSVTISGNSKIKQYNKDQDNIYTNDTLDCYSIDGYSRVACYSSFITDLLDGEYGNIVNENSKVLDIRDVGDNNTEYFTLWNKGIDEAKMIGPSWK